MTTKPLRERLYDVMDCDIRLQDQKPFLNLTYCYCFIFFKSAKNGRNLDGVATAPLTYRNHYVTIFHFDRFRQKLQNIIC